MKKDGKYRFCLQFAGDTYEQIQAGELLERLGNKKSNIVIAALNDYIEKHPELAHDNPKVEVMLSSALDKGKIEKLVISMIEEHLALTNIIEDTIHEDKKIISETQDSDIAIFLNNLDAFNQ